MRLKYVAAAVFAILLLGTAAAWVTAQVVPVKPVPPKVIAVPPGSDWSSRTTPCSLLLSG